MKLDEIVDLFRKKPYHLDMGKGLLSRRFHTTPETIMRAKAIVRGARIPKILIFDIETAPMRAYVWRMWKENIAPCQVISDWFMIAWSAKWLYAGEVMGDVLTSKEAVAEDDSRIVKSLWKLIDAADIVVSHNGDRFDIPRMNARFIIHDLYPPKPYFSVDTCQTARRQFGFSSNRLDSLADYFGFDHKLDTDFSLWQKCLEGDSEALGYMSEYNKRDVTLLEEVYLKLRPWIRNHPNISNILQDMNVCTVCGSYRLEKIEGEYYTGVNRYELYRCKDCGAVIRGRKALPSVVGHVNNMR